jgi:hypothetical protein
MHIRKCSLILLAAAAVLLAACGKQERLEAVRFTQTLAAKQTNFTAAGALEKDLIANARGWCDAIAGYGSGRGPELEQNAVVASELAKSAMAASAQLSEVRQAIDAETLTGEFPRGIRSTLTSQLTRRQRALQDMRAMLEESAAEFRQYRQSKSYDGSSYPGAVSKLDALLSAYKTPEDAVGQAMQSLRTKYNIAAGS